MDRRDGKGLAQLLRELGQLEGLRWIRLLYCYPRQAGVVGGGERRGREGEGEGRSGAAMRCRVSRRCRAGNGSLHVCWARRPSCSYCCSQPAAAAAHGACCACCSLV